MKLIKYLTVGGSAFVVEYLSFLALIFFSNKLLFAQIISWCLGYLVSFVGHRQFTYRTKSDYKLSKKRQFIMYGLVALCTLTVSSVLLYVLSLIIPAYISKLISMIATVLISYYLLGRIVFRK